MKHLTALGLTTALLLTGCGGGSTASNPSTMTPTPTVTGLPVDARDTVSVEGGDGKQNTDQFNLRGNYAVDWVAKCGPYGGVFYVTLWRVDDPSYYQSDLTGILQIKAESPSREGSTNLYNVADTQWYLQVNSSECDWVITLSPN